MLPGNEPPIGREKIEEYRRMSIGEKFSLTLRMTEEHFSALLKQPPDVVDRWFEELRQENDERNQRMREHMARTGRIDLGPIPEDETRPNLPLLGEGAV